MKFQMLAVGDRFEFEGKEYVKVGPLTAACEGGQRMIPRFAKLKPLDAPAVSVRDNGRKLDEALVLAAFEAFMRDFANMAQVEAGKPVEAHALRSALDVAQKKFLSELEKSVSES